MNELMYSFRDNNVRIMEIEGQVWFAVKDVCEVLELSNPSMVVNRLDKDEVAKFNLGGLFGETNFVNEYGIYNLIFGSRKPEAKEFKRWVTHEVLPSIRKRGIYATEDITEKILGDPQFMIKLLQELQTERDARKMSEEKVAILTHVNRDYNATEIAKELGFTSASAFNADLQAKGIQFKQNGTWLLYSKYSDKGYVNIKQDILDNGKVVYNRRFTQTGREWLLELYKK